MATQDFEGHVSPDVVVQVVEDQAQQEVATPAIVLVTGAAQGDNDLKPPLQNFNSPTTGQNTSFFNSKASPLLQQDSVHQAPEDATTPSHQLSALCSDSPGGGVMLAQPKTLEPPQTSEGSNFVQLIDDFNSALRKACKAGKALQECCERKQGDKLDAPCLNSHTEEEDCQKELKDYKNRCTKLIEYERHLKEAYREEHETLKTRLRSMKDKETASSIDHKMEMDLVQRSHNEEVRELQDTISMQEEYQALRDLQYHPSEVAELNKLKNSYKCQQKEVETLRNTLAEKEKNLHQLSGRINAMEIELERHSLLSDQKHTKNQLQRCEEIGEMVSRLTSITSGREMNELVEEIFKQTAKMKTNSKSTSWRC